MIKLINQNKSNKIYSNKNNHFNNNKKLKMIK